MCVMGWHWSELCEVVVPGRVSIVRAPVTAYICVPCGSFPPYVMYVLMLK